MVFNSLEFLLFAALVFPLDFALRTWSARTAWLLLASWAFYASWSPRFLLLLIATSWIDFVFAQHIDRAVRAGGEADLRRARRLVTTSVTMNLGVLTPAHSSSPPTSATPCTCGPRRSSAWPPSPASA